MFESTFILRFTHRDCSEIEEQEHTVASTAWEAFRPSPSRTVLKSTTASSCWSTPGETARSARWHR